MLTGHVAVAMGAHGIRNSIPLWVLVVASQLPDWADAVVCSSGLRPSVTGMYSHSWAATAGLALLAGLISTVLLRDLAGGLVVSAVVVMHTAGDYVTGIKPTWPDGPMIGMQLYSVPALDFVFETVVVAACWLLYRRSFPQSRRSDGRLLILPAALIAIQAVSDIVLFFSPTLQKC